MGTPDFSTKLQKKRPCFPQKKQESGRREQDWLTRNMFVMTFQKDIDFGVGSESEPPCGSVRVFKVWDLNLLGGREKTLHSALTPHPKYDQVVVRGMEREGMFWHRSSSVRLGSSYSIFISTCKPDLKNRIQTYRIACPVSYTS